MSVDRLIVSSSLCTSFYTVKLKQTSGGTTRKKHIFEWRGALTKTIYVRLQFCGLTPDKWLTVKLQHGHSCFHHLWGDLRPTGSKGCLNEQDLQECKSQKSYSMYSMCTVNETLVVGLSPETTCSRPITWKTHHSWNTSANFHSL